MTLTPKPFRKWRHRLASILLLFVAAYLVLLIPAAGPPVPESPGHPPFLWDQDALWEAYEEKYLKTRQLGCSPIQTQADSLFLKTEILIRQLDTLALAPSDPYFGLLEKHFFELGPMVSVCHDDFKRYIGIYSQLRSAVKEQSNRWDLKDRVAREALYRLLYGGRAAVEEVILQVAPQNWDALMPGTDESSNAPAASILGVRIRSGDILLSRGGAAVSALIARGNDFPGNFSHVALVHIDEQSHQASIIEAHIELGVAVSDLETYLKDKKLRVMALRPRANLPVLLHQPMLPHKAANYALEEAQADHIPYDFAMNFADPSRKFCSEVAFDAYHQNGLDLWMGISTISSPGLLNWLSALGVAYFETHEPSDLEYDPQLAVVAEWLNLSTLFDDHVDNAVIDAMLEEANAGAQLNYSQPLLPFVRLGKAYSWMLNQFGRVGPIPEGMSAVTALRVRKLAENHAGIKAKVMEKAEQFQQQYGYLPPYWELYKMAKIDAEGLN